MMKKKYYTAGQATDDSITLHMSIASCITKYTNTHSEYVTLIALPQRQWLYESVSVLRCTYIACVVFCVDLRTNNVYFPVRLKRIAFYVIFAQQNATNAQNTFPLLKTVVGKRKKIINWEQDFLYITE